MGKGTVILFNTNIPAIEALMSSNYSKTKKKRIEIRAKRIFNPTSDTLTLTCKFK